MSVEEPDLDQLQTETILSVAGSLFHIPMFIVIISIIKKVVVFEKEMYENKHEMDIKEHLISTPVNS